MGATHIFARALSAVCAAIVLALMAGTTAVTAQESVVDTGGQSVTSREIVLPLGKAAIIELPRAAADILVSDPDIVETVIRTPRRVYVLGKEAGQANAFFFDSANRTILNLEIQVEQDADAIRHLMGKLVPNARIDVESLNGNVILSGQVDTPLEAQRAQEVAGRFVGEENVVNMLSVREPAQVMLRVRVVEMQRRLIRQLGIDLNGVARVNNAAVDFAVQNSFAITGAPLGGLGGNVLTRGFGNVDNLDFAFDVFEQNGLVKTLAEPNLTAISGASASFLAGGEFPVPEATANGVPSISFKQFGVSLNFTPIVYSKGRIQLQMNTAVSEISAVNGLSVAGRQTVDSTGEVVNQEGFVVPGVTTRNAQTTVELPSGGSIAIAGLLQENITEFVDGVPGIKETPVLGALFRSQEFQSNQTELVVIATPYLVAPTQLANLTDPANGHVNASAVQSALLGRLEAAYGVKGGGVGEANLQGPLGFILD